MYLDLQEVKQWLRLDVDEHADDALIQSLIAVAKNYLYEATGRKTFGKQTATAKLLCQYLITHWYEDRNFYNPSPQSVRKPIITMMMTQLQYGGDDDGDTNEETKLEIRRTQQSGFLE